MIHIQTPCPTGWGYDPAKSIELARLAVQTGAWILYEYENGRFTINSKPKKLKPLKEYIGIQRRFKHLSNEEVEELQKTVTENYEKAIRRLEYMS